MENFDLLSETMVLFINKIEKIENVEKIMGFLPEPPNKLKFGIVDNRIFVNSTSGSGMFFRFQL